MPHKNHPQYELALQNLAVFMRDQQLQMILSYLRWMDAEKGMKWDEFSESLKRYTPAGFSFVKATESPFSFSIYFAVQGSPEIVFEVCVTNTGIQLFSIAAGQAHEQTKPT